MVVENPAPPSPEGSTALPSGGERGPERAAEIRSAIAAHRAQKRSPTKNLTLFLATGLIYLAVVGWEIDPVSLALFFGVLLFHEAGHAVAMLAFGYRNLSIFFVPFLGALMIGRKEDAPAWQEAVVSLAGPLPGLFIGLILFPFMPAVAEGSALATLAIYLVVLNGFNLLPFLPLDGGHFASAVIFRRNRHLETAFAYLGALALLVVGITLQWWALGIFSVFAFMGASHSRKIREVAHELGEEHGPAVSEPDDALLVEMDEVVRARLKIEAAPTRAQVVDQIRQQSNRRAPGALATALLALAYLSPLPVAGVSAVAAMVVSLGDAETYPSGALKSQGATVRGQPQGWWSTYHESGELESEGEYRQGVKVGLWKYYDEEGDLLREEEAAAPAAED